MVACSGFVVSGLLGIAAGYLGGIIDTATMRLVDFMLALPALLVCIVLVTVVQGGYWLAILVIAILNVQGDLRLVRSATLQQRALPYIEAAQLSGILYASGSCTATSGVISSRC